MMNLRIARPLLYVLVSLTLLACANSSPPAKPEREGKEGGTATAASHVNKIEDFATARETLVKLDQPLRAFSMMEKLAKRQKFMSPVAAQFAAFLGRDALVRELAEAGRPPFKPDGTVVLADLQAMDALAKLSPPCATCAS